MNSNFSDNTVSFLRNLLEGDTLQANSGHKADALELYVTARTLQRRREQSAAQRSKPPKNSVKITLGDGPGEVTLTQEQYNTVDDLLAKTRLIGAIKELRIITGAGLRDCKLACENPLNFPKNHHKILGYQPHQPSWAATVRSIYIHDMGYYDIPTIVHDDIGHTLAPFGVPKNGNKMDAIRKLQEWWFSEKGSSLPFTIAEKTVENTAEFPVLLNH